MDTVLGRGYSINEESGVTDFYSPPSSIVDEDDDFFYDEQEDEVELFSTEPISNSTFSSASIEEINEINLEGNFKPLTLKLVTTETTPPSTPLIPRRLLDPINHTTKAFQTITIDTIQPITDMSTTNWSLSTLTNPLINNTPKTATSLLTPTSMDRYLIEHCRLSDSIYKASTPLGTTTNRHQAIAVQHTEVTNETSRLYSYMTPVNGLAPNVRTASIAASNSWSTFDDTLSIPSQANINNNPYTPQYNMKPSSPCLNNSLFPQRINPLLPNFNGSLSHSSSFQNQDPWFLSELSTKLRQNQSNTGISLSATAQQILAANSNNNNRPLRSEKIDIEVIKHLIQEANWKRQCGMKKEVCVFCRNNGENEIIYSSHSLKDSIGNVTCPILRAYQCPICGATGSQAHTIKYCQATGDDNNRYIPTPYEKMLHMQTFGFEDNITPTMSTVYGQIGSPSSFYSNGWSDSYL